jgi:DNA-binding XRE family transcriptional regulator
VRIDPLTLEPKYRVIGVEQWSGEEGFDEESWKTGVTGICGSGIIEVVAEMYLAGIISEDGVIDGSLAERSDRIIPNGRTFSYLLRKGRQGEPDITVTQNDVRAIQLAKAALYAGIKLLMEKQGADHVDMIRFAGAFGSFIDPKFAMVLGLIPDCELSEVKAVGNAAGTGALMALLNRNHRREIEREVGKIEKIETALEPNFQQLFIDAMALPNKVDPFPKLSQQVTLPPDVTTQSAGGWRRRRRRTQARTRRPQRPGRQRGGLRRIAMNEMVTIRKDEYERLKEAAEDLADIIAYDRAVRDGGEAIPAAFVKRMIDGEHPVRVYRDLRGLSQTQLSENSGVNRVQITDIEAGRKSGSIETVRKLALALGVTIDDLV